MSLVLFHYHHGDLSLTGWGLIGFLILMGELGGRVAISGRRK